MENIIEQENQVAVIERSLEVFQNAPVILLNHQARATKALSVADSIIKQWEDSFGIADPEVRMAALSKADERSMKFLSNCTEASDQMKEARKAITQLMDMLKALYTKEENSLDPKKGEKPVSIQQNRNRYASEVIKEQERQRKAAEHKAAKEREANEMRSFINKTITQRLLDFTSEKKLKLTESFNKITLVDFDTKSAQLQKLSIEFPKDKLGLTILYSLPFSYRHDETELNTIRTQEHGKYDFDAFYARYSMEIEELKQSLVDRLPSKKTELLEEKRKADEAEAERRAEAERQRLAQIKRDQEIAAAGAIQKAKLEKENKLAQEREKQRLKDLEEKAEQERLQAEAERERREAEDKQRLAKEAEDNRLKAEQEAELAKSAADAMTLFNETTEAAGAAAVPENRQNIVITVTHQAGWVELFQFWYQRAGIKASLEDCEKMTFEKLKKFAEKEAKDTPKKKGERIVSKLLTYSEAISAVNRKAK